MDKMMPRLLLALLNILAVLANEQACSSFPYDEKMLKKIVRLRHKVEQRDEALRDWETMMDNSLAQLEQKKKNMSETIATTKKIIAEIDSSMTVWETAIKKKLESDDLTVQSFLEDYKTPTVLFKARLVSSLATTVGKVLVFREVIANVGDGYNNCTGYFTAPVPGTYMFTAQVCASSTGGANVYLVTNGTNIESTSHRGNTYWGECVTLTGVSVLDKGEQASVQGAYDKVNALVQSRLRWTTFSGILINIFYETTV